MPYSQSNHPIQEAFKYLYTPLEEAAERINLGAHRFVRHQNNWFQFGDRPIAWFDISVENYPFIALQSVVTWFKQ